MIVEIKIPEIGESIEEVTVEEWLKKEGDAIEEDEPIAVIETDKTTIELPAPKPGTLERIDKRAGEQAAVGDVIGRITTRDGHEAEGRNRKDTEPRPAAEETTNRPKTAEEKSGIEEPDREQDDTRTRTVPAKTDEAVEEEPAIKEKGGGKHEAPSDSSDEAPRAAATAPERAPEEHKRQGPSALPMESEELPETTGRQEKVVPMSPVRQTIAERLLHAQRNAALLTTFNKVDTSGVLDLRRRYQDAFREKHGVKLGIMSFFVKATVEALKRIPELNAEVRDQNIVYRNYYDIGIAIGSDKGLVVPVLRNAERMSMAEIERRIKDFAERADRKRLEIRELQGGTFTISNGGVFGSMLSTPIVNPPQSGVLGLHAIEDQAVVRDGSIVVRPMMYLALSYDHRIVDGREAVTFLKTVCDRIEDPASILLEL